MATFPNPIQIVHPQQLTNAAVIYYTSTNTKTRIDALTITNTTGGPITATVYIVPAAGSVGDPTTIVKTISIPGPGLWNGIGVVGQIMTNLDTLQMLASAGSDLTVMASGTQLGL